MTTIENKQRAPICGIFGHVDSGKTSFLSKLKSYDTVESGGITQGLSSIFISIDKIKGVCDKIEDIKSNENFEVGVPGILFIDTPGHEAFKNFRIKACDICDIAIVIIDIEKGIEEQTIDSIQLLKQNKIPFIIVLTKLDKTYEWQTTNTFSLKKSLKEQTTTAISILTGQIEDIKYELSKYDINSEFYFKNKTPGKTYSIIPVSNISGEGFNDLINFMIYIIQNFMTKKLIFEQKPKMFIMEKTFDKQLGWTLNVILSNGIVNVGDNLLIQTTNGPIKSVIRNIIGLKYDDTKNKYTRQYQSTGIASDSLIIFAPELENSLTGEFMNVFYTNEEYEQQIIEFNKKEIRLSFIESIKTDSSGYYLHTSTEDEFEAGYNVFKTNEIVISNGSCGPLTEKTIDKFEIYLTKQKDLLEEYKVLLYYTNESKKSNKFVAVEEYAKKKNIKILYNDVIYKLVEELKTTKKTIVDNRKDKMKKEGLIQYPVELKLLKQFLFVKGGNNNILAGFKVIEGSIVKGTEIIAINTKNPSEIHILGKVLTMEKNHKDVETGNKMDELCIKLENPNHLLYGKHFDDSYIFYSNITRPILELLKRDFKTDLSKTDWLLIAKMIKLTKI